LAAHRLKLGRYFGIELFVHWSFGLLVAYVAFSTYSTGGSPAMIGFSVAQLLAVFLCVTLHEYGHSLAARSYGVETVDITLLPIGGVARLKRIPRVPVQEFVIAIAGPAVNVAIAALLALGLAVAIGFKGLGLLGQSSVGLAFSETDEEMDRFIGETFMEPSLLGFAISLLVINLLLVVFNLIPAFPMDGGRVLRSLLAMALPYANATRWAQRIGVVCAALMAAFAISSDPPRLVMLAIAAFIVYAGQMEARQVDLTERLDQLTVGDVMTRKAPEVPMNWNLVQLQQWWQEQTTATVAVTGIGNILVGTLSVSDLARTYEALEAKGHDPLMLTAGEIADHDADSVHPSALLEAVVGSSQKYRQVPVVDSQYRLIGWLDFDTLFARASLSRFAKQSPQLQATTPTEADAAQPANYLF
jgi:Zn-dependent protease